MEFPDNWNVFSEALTFSYYNHLHGIFFLTYIAPVPAWLSSAQQTWVAFTWWLIKIIVSLRQWKCLLHWKEMPPGLRGIMRTFVSLFIRCCRWLWLLNSPPHLLAVGLDLSPSLSCYFWSVLGWKWKVPGLSQLCLIGADQPPNKGLGSWIHANHVYSMDLMALTLYIWKCSYSQLFGVIVEVTRQNTLGWMGSCCAFLLVKW